MSHSQIQKFSMTREIEGVLCTYCNILRAWLPVNRAAQPRAAFRGTFHPPINNGRNQRAVGVSQ